MNDTEFVDFCYREALGRPPKEDDLARVLKQLQTKQKTREDFLVEILSCKERRRKQANDEAYPPGHFYSVVPSYDTRMAYVEAEADDPSEIGGIDLNHEAQVGLLERFSSYYSEHPFVEKQEEGRRFFLDNNSYAYHDAIGLYSMMREYAPKRIVEVGSGFSSAIMLDVNERFFDNTIQLTFIEPYPRRLRSLLSEADEKVVDIRESLVQDVDMDVFEALEPNDFLFIDSTHVSKLKSDVNFEFFEILPRIKPGVFIHFHDIFWPFEYPKAWVKKGVAWNEMYVLRAFLMNNPNYEIVYFTNYLAAKLKPWYQEHMPLASIKPGGAFWMKKLA